MKRIVIMLFVTTMLMLTSGMPVPSVASLSLPLINPERGQCHSVTKSGNRCKRKAVPQKLYCRQHSANTQTSSKGDCCCYISDAGVRCTRRTSQDIRYCTNHSDSLAN